ncbi:MAG: helix-turn-helix transcriptional regulator [Phycisphaeraceae bacterium]|nr:helix-turn-helix transcriptional regulator [Phycisphaeraceae bacterium]MBX3367703.1 helix-turn-helix transcriptional regulator [Phycisphaeraceae bacterium]
MRRGRFIKEFGNAIRSRRQAIGLSQEELAFQAGMHRTAISHIEQGTRSSTLETIEKLARALKVQPNELMPSIDMGRSR